MARFSGRSCDRLRCQFPNKDQHRKCLATAHEPVVLYSPVIVVTCPQMSVVGPGFNNNTFYSKF